MWKTLLRRYVEDVSLFQMAINPSNAWSKSEIPFEMEKCSIHQHWNVIHATKKNDCTNNGVYHVAYIKNSSNWIIKHSSISKCAFAKEILSKIFFYLCWWFLKFLFRIRLQTNINHISKRENFINFRVNFVISLWFHHQ